MVRKRGCAFSVASDASRFFGVFGGHGHPFPHGFGEQALVRGLPKPFVPKGVARAGFQIAFERERGAFAVESNVSFHPPGPKRSSGGIAAAVVITESLTKVGGEPNITVTFVPGADEAVDVVHAGNRHAPAADVTTLANTRIGVWVPPSLRASEGAAPPSPRLPSRGRRYTLLPSSFSAARRWWQPRNSW